MQKAQTVKKVDQWVKEIKFFLVYDSSSSSSISQCPNGTGLPYRLPIRRTGQPNEIGTTIYTSSSAY
jgi:hypothetical protein